MAKRPFIVPASIASPPPSHTTVLCCFCKDHNSFTMYLKTQPLGRWMHCRRVLRLFTWPGHCCTDLLQAPLMWVEEGVLPLVLKCWAFLRSQFCKLLGQFPSLASWYFQTGDLAAAGVFIPGTHTILCTWDPNDIFFFSPSQKVTVLLQNEIPTFHFTFQNQITIHNQIKLI